MREPGVKRGYPDTQAFSSPGRTTAEAKDAPTELRDPTALGSRCLPPAPALYPTANGSILLSDIKGI